MSGPYNVPRNVKGEGRILFIFSTKALIYTVVGLLIGLIFKVIMDMIGIGIVGIILLVLFAGIGFVIATIKVPDTTAFEITSKTGGENIDDVLKRLIRFKMKRNRIYTYSADDRKQVIVEKGGTKDE